MLLNAEKKKRMPLYNALADVEALAPAKKLYEEGVTGLEAEYRQYLRAVELLAHCGVSRAELADQKVRDYKALAELNLKIKSKRKALAICKDILNSHKHIAREVETIESKEHPDIQRER